MIALKLPVYMSGSIESRPDGHSGFYEPAYLWREERLEKLTLCMDEQDVNKQVRRSDQHGSFIFLNISYLQGRVNSKFPPVSQRVFNT